MTKFEQLMLRAMLLLLPMMRNAEPPYNRVRDLEDDIEAELVARATEERDETHG